MLVLLQPCWAVPKGRAPFYRLITDARFANEIYSYWGVSYTAGAQLSSILNRCDFTFSVDISDAYHLSLWAGCGGELQRPMLSTPRSDGGLSTRQQRSLATHTSAAFTFSGGNHLVLWTGCGGELRVEQRPVLSSRRDGAQRMSLHFLHMSRRV